MVLNGIIRSETWFIDLDLTGKAPERIGIKYHYLSKLTPKCLKLLSEIAQEIGGLYNLRRKGMETGSSHSRTFLHLDGDEIDETYGRIQRSIGTALPTRINKESKNL